MRNRHVVRPGILDDPGRAYVRSKSCWGQESCFDLRHSAASLLLASGVELVEVSKLLGHSQIRLTADLYGHLVKQTATKATRVMDAVLKAKA